MYTRYFLPGQKILLRSCRADQHPPRIEAVTARLISYDAGQFELALVHPWQSEEPFFAAQNPLVEMLSERFGLGLRSTALFRGIFDGKLIRLQANNDLNLFRPRPKPRINTNIGLQHFSARTGSSTFYRKWSQQVIKLKDTSAALSSPILPLGEVNLSSTGIRTILKSPVTSQDLCLMMLELQPDQIPICTLAEVIWTAPHDDPQTQVAGLQFLNILHIDQERIEHFIKTDRVPASQTRSLST